MDKLNFRRILFIDPMSYGTIGEYDNLLLNGIVKTSGDKIKIDYACSRYCQYHYSNPIKQYKVFSYNRIKNNILKGISYILSLLTICIIILIKRPKIIHIQWIRKPVIDLFFLNIYKKLGTSIVYTAHNVLPHNDNSTKTKNNYSKCYELVDCIIVHSETTKKELIDNMNIDESKIQVISHGLLKIKADENRIEESCQEFRRMYNMDDKIIISCLGVQSAYKGTDILIDVWRKYPEIRMNSNVLLVIMGKCKGLDISDVETLNNIILEDRYLTDAEYVGLLRMSDITVLPYREISQSGALLGALAEHTLVMVSNKGGLPDPLKIANIGWNMGEPTVENLYACISQAISDYNTLKNMRSSTLEWSKLEKTLSWDEIGKKTLFVYNKN